MQTELALDLYDGAADGDYPTIPTSVLRRLNPVDPTRSNPNPNCGERALLRAILQDAILCLTGQGVAKRERAVVMAEARRWMLSQSRRTLFTFQSICEVLDLDPEYLRDKLLRGRNGTNRGSCESIPAADDRALLRRVRRVRMRGNQHTRGLHPRHAG